MASDINLLCMLKLYAMREEIGAVPLWPIHDAIIFDMESEACVPKIKKIMEDYSGELVNGRMKFRVDVKVGNNWGDAMPFEKEDG